MANRLRSAWLARATVAAAVFALPLLGAGVAQAAIAGAPHEQTSNRPDLVSATIIPALTGSSGGSVDFCFDKTITSVDHSRGSDAFQLAGYRSHNSYPADGGYALETTIPPPAGLPPDSCVRANFLGSGDLNQYTIGFVENRTVAANGGVPTGLDGNNYSDSTPLTGSNTHNGTSGFTAGPDLQSGIIDTTSNSIAFYFDQNVDFLVNPPVPQDFHFIDAAGNICWGNSISIVSGGNTVVVGFDGDWCSNNSHPGESVSNAVRIGDVQGAVFSENDRSTSNVDNDVVVSGDGTTALPDLTDVTMEADQSALNFTFDKVVRPVNPEDFRADLSNGTMVEGNNATVVNSSNNSTTIRVTFTGFSTWDEYVIGGSVRGFEDYDSWQNHHSFCAVQISAIDGACAPPGWHPLDAPFGNIGALSTGFTTGPDVLGAIGNTTNNTVQVALDQRAFHSDPYDIGLLDGTGNLITTAGLNSVSLPTVANGVNPSAFPAVVTFGSGQLQTAKNLALEDAFFSGTDNGNVANDAFSTNLGTGSFPDCREPNYRFYAPHCQNQDSVSQILQLITTSSLVKAAKHAKVVSTASAVHMTKTRQAAAAKKLSSFLKRHAKHHRHHRQHRKHRR